MTDERQGETGCESIPGALAMDGSEVAGGDPAETDPEDAIATAQWLFWDYVRDLRAKHAAIEAVDWEALNGADLKRATDTAKTVRQAIHLLMEERQKIEKYRKNIARDGGGELDLDAARDEIGRRLACLRRAGAG